MDLEEVERILRLMEEHDLVEVEIEDPEKGSRIRLRKAEAVSHVSVASQPVALAPAPSPASPGQPEAAPADRDAGSLVEVPSPMVGTFYRAAGPDEAAFVEVGDTIDEETVVCIIEAMKVMNEIKAEVTGEVVEVLVQNGEAVEFGQPLLVVRVDE